MKNGKDPLNSDYLTIGLIAKSKTRQPRQIRVLLKRSLASTSLPQYRGTDEINKEALGAL